MTITTPLLSASRILSTDPDPKQVNKESFKLSFLFKNHFQEMTKELASLSEEEAARIASKLKSQKFPVENESIRRQVQTLIGIATAKLHKAPDLSNCDCQQTRQVHEEVGGALMREKLDHWVEDNDCDGHKLEAARRITQAFENKLPALDLSSLNLKGLPDIFDHLTHLSEVNLEENQICDLPDSFAALQELEHLNLAANQLRHVPEPTLQLGQLKQLILSGNSISGRISENLNQLSQLQFLALDDCGLAELPEGLGELSELESLHVGGNRLKDLPPSFENLVKLQDLGLSGNRFKKIPKVLLKLRQLKSCELGDNRIKSLPETFSELTQLEALGLSYNRLEILPKEIVRLQGLRVLNLCGNQLSELPEEVTQLKSLQELYVKRNKLKELPEAMGELKQLRILQIYDNKELKTVPQSLAMLPYLNELALQNTAVNPSEARVLLEAFEQEAVKVTLRDLPAILEQWQSTAELEPSSTLALLDLMDETETSCLVRWLVQLEKAEDFRRNPKQLAQLIYPMLQRAGDDEEFRATFFAILSNNLSKCGDRAAMSINQAYCSWVLSELKESSNLREKVDLMVGLARTTALRSTLGDLIATKERELGHPLSESVEIFLYYETFLKDELNLVTAINSMSHPQFGFQKWISKNYLIEEVERKYIDNLLEQAEFQNLIENDEDYQLLYQENFQALLTKQDALERAANFLSERVYAERQQELQNEYNCLKYSSVLNWLDQVK